jgi:hypothetical protein
MLPEEVNAMIDPTMPQTLGEERRARYLAEAAEDRLARTAHPGTARRAWVVDLWYAARLSRRRYHEHRLA